MYERATLHGIDDDDDYVIELGGFMDVVSDLAPVVAGTGSFIASGFNPAVGFAAYSATDAAVASMGGSNPRPPRPITASEVGTILGDPATRREFELLVSNTPFRASTRQRILASNETAADIANSPRDEWTASDRAIYGFFAQRLGSLSVTDTLPNGQVRVTLPTGSSTTLPTGDVVASVPRSILRTERTPIPTSTLAVLGGAALLGLLLMTR